MDATPPGQSALDRFFDRAVDLVELLAAFFLAIVALITFVSVILRYGFAASIPAGFDIGRLLLGIAVFWGIAGAAHRGDHIQVDLLWTALKPAGRRILDILATAFTAVAMAVFAWMSLQHVQSTRASNQTTFDVPIPLWPFYAIAAIGILLGAVLVGLRLINLVRGR